MTLHEPAEIRSGAAGLARICGLLGDPSRAAMCLAMLDGRSWTVSQLAAEAGIGKAAASEHVVRLVDGGLALARSQGRSKYVRLAGPDVAALLESASAMAAPERARSLAAVRELRRFAVARTCYDHLAGRLGVAVYDGLVADRLIDNRHGLVLTGGGRDWFSGLGIDATALDRRGGRRLLRECLDVTERRSHLAGGLGAALCGAFFDRDWGRRTDRSRVLDLTPAGERALESRLGVTPARLAVGA
jgi:DNA-binding transcriptional ArsR family regulator